MYPYEAGWSFYFNRSGSPEELFNRRLSNPIKDSGFTSVQSAVACGSASIAVKAAQVDTFIRQELSLSAIMRGANIQIEWCLNLENHLDLWMQGDKYQLQLFWPSYTDSTGSGIER